MFAKKHNWQTSKIRSTFPYLIVTEISIAVHRRNIEGSLALREELRSQCALNRLQCLDLRPIFAGKRKSYQCLITADERKATPLDILHASTNLFNSFAKSRNL